MEQVCPNCHKRYAIETPGRYSCPDCRTILEEPATAAGPLDSPPSPRVTPKRTSAPGPLDEPSPPVKSTPRSTKPTAPAAAKQPDAGKTSEQNKATWSEVQGQVWNPNLASGSEGETAAPAAELSAELKEQVSTLEAKIQSSPRARLHYVELSRIYREAGHKELAATTLERFLKFEPNNTFIKGKIAYLRGRGKSIKKSTRPVQNRAIREIREEQERSTRIMTRGAILVILLLAALIARPFLFPSAVPVVAADYSTRNPAWSPRGDLIAFVANKSDGGKLSVYDLRRKTVRELASMNGQHLAWSPDGTRIAYEATDEDWNDTVWVVLASGGTATRIAAGSSPSWGPNSTLTLVCRIASPDNPEAFYREQEGVCVADVGLDEIEKINTTGGEKPSFSPTSEIVVFEILEWEGSTNTAAATDGHSNARDMDQLLEASLEGGATNNLEANRGLSRELEIERRNNQREARSFDGVRVMSNLWIWRGPGSKVEQLTTDGMSRAPSWTADGKRILFTRSTDGGDQIWEMSPDGDDSRLVLALEFQGRESVALTPDGKSVIFRSVIRVADAASIMTVAEPIDLHIVPVGGTEATRLTNKHSFKQRFSLAPDGSRLVYEYTNGNTSQTELWLLKL